jgi:hypothetical protein
MALAILSTQFTLTEPSMPSLALILVGVNLVKIQTKFEFLDKGHGILVSYLSNLIQPNDVLWKNVRIKM